MRHFKHVSLSTAAGLAALLLCSHPASAAASSSGGKEEVYELVAKQTQGSGFIDVDGSSGPSQGDEIVTTGDLFVGATAVGSYGQVCTLTRTAPGDEFDLQCVGSFALAPGQITAQGRFTVTSAGPGDINLAITGGTGSYRTARGFIHSVYVSDTETQLTVHLIR